VITQREIRAIFDHARQDLAPDLPAGDALPAIQQEVMDKLSSMERSLLTAKRSNGNRSRGQNTK
jgi:hypothetical protein